MRCRHCSSNLTLSLVDLGTAPPSNAYLTEADLAKPEKWYPLRILVCTHCWLVQTEDYVGREDLFDRNYAYFSSFSTLWLEHAEQYVEEVVRRFNLTESSLVVEVAANDGYLLQYIQKRGIPCYGVEPTASTAAAARAKGIKVIEDFFGEALAEHLVEEYGKADLLVANNVLAHVSDINDFVLGFSKLLSPQGVATFEFPHLLNLIEQSQFDTIYHEHYSYLSLTAVAQIFLVNGLMIFDVEEISTHGGSLRIFAQIQESGRQALSPKVQALLEREKRAGMLTPSYYANFQDRVNRIKYEFLSFLLDAKRQGKSVAGYGAAAKGSTLMNYTGIREDMISFVADRNPAKQGKFMPGSRIPIVDESCLERDQPDYIVILPWNLKRELVSQLDYVCAWRACLVTVIPEVTIL